MDNDLIQFNDSPVMQESSKVNFFTSDSFVFLWTVIQIEKKSEKTI